MNDKELADRVVALGVGIRNSHPAHGSQLKAAYTYSWDLEAKDFVRDWRVSGALMERCLSLDYDQANSEHTVSVWTSASFTGPWATVCNESLPRAIIEACVEALQEHRDE